MQYRPVHLDGTRTPLPDPPAWTPAWASSASSAILQGRRHRNYDNGPDPSACPIIAARSSKSAAKSYDNPDDTRTLSASIAEHGPQP